MRAEYDFQNNRVVSLEMDDGRVVSTNNPRVLGASTQWLPVVVVYPDGYDQRFHALLNPGSVEYRYVETGNRVEVHYPDADFSPATVREHMRSQIKNAARTRMSNTDWYLVRKVETGADVPDDIAAERQAIRDKEAAYQQQLDATSDADVPNFTFTFTTDEPKQATTSATDIGGPVRGGDGREWITDATHPDEKGNPVRHATADEVPPQRPFDAASTRGQIDEPEPKNVPTGLAWSLDDKGQG